MTPRRRALITKTALRSAQYSGADTTERYKGMPIIRKVKQYIIDNSLILPGDRILVALSGGGDSVALLHILRAVSDELGATVCAAHFNHCIRGAEADRDEDFSRTLAMRLMTEFRAGRCDIPKLALERGQGLEECAREQRYAFLFNAAAELGCNKLATAHHSTDNVETVLFHIARGSGINGIGGIPPMRRDGVIRPLLCCSKAEIEEFLAVNSLNYVTDSTNSDTDITRNFIRAGILPLLRRLNPAVEVAIGRLSADAREDEEYLTSEARALPKELDLGKLSELPPPILKRYLLLRYAEFRQINTQLDHLHISDICRRLKKGERHFRLSLPGSVAVIADGKHLAFIADKEIAEPFCVRLSKPGEYYVGNGNIFITECKEELTEWLKRQPNARSAEYSFHGSTFELTARSRLPGDKYLRNGIHRTVRKELNAIGYPAHKRASLPVICDGNGIFWVPPLKPRNAVNACDKEKTKQLIYIGYTEN